MNLSVLIVLAGSLLTPSAPACSGGAYALEGGDFVVLGAPTDSVAAGSRRYLLRDGRRGSTGDAGALVRCEGGGVVVPSAGQAVRPRSITHETDTAFVSHGAKLVGRLIEPSGPADPRRPLVVMVHGSEKTSPLKSAYAYALVAQGLSAFVYDKRGTGSSEGEYTQNFELLADDATAALAQARKLAAGRFGRAGYFGGSQGGWVAPLAATLPPADFVAVGFGLVVSPIEEDREQLLGEAHEQRLTADDLALVEDLSVATARLVRSHFESGFEDLERLKARIGSAAWARTIRGEYSGDMLRMSDAQLRRVGRALFDNLELIWDYDAEQTLRRLHAPLLWVLAGSDREAPIAATRKALEARAATGLRADVYLFPDTDHGMLEFRIAADGSRTPTRITSGYLQLLADWIKGSVHGPYGRGERLP